MHDSLLTFSQDGILREADEGCRDGTEFGMEKTEKVKRIPVQNQTLQVCSTLNWETRHNRLLQNHLLRLHWQYKECVTMDPYCA